MIIRNLQDFMKSKYYNGKSVIGQLGVDYWPTFQIPNTICYNVYPQAGFNLINQQFFVYKDELNRKFILLVQKPGTRCHHSYIYYRNAVNYNESSYICLGQGKSDIHREIKGLYTNRGGCLLTIAMTVESIINRGRNT